MTARDRCLTVAELRALLNEHVDGDLTNVTLVKVGTGGGSPERAIRRLGVHAGQVVFPVEHSSVVPLAGVAFRGPCEHHPGHIAPRGWVGGAAHSFGQSARQRFNRAKKRASFRPAW